MDADITMYNADSAEKPLGYFLSPRAGVGAARRTKRSSEHEPTPNQKM
jgi:hypothetical protein